MTCCISNITNETFCCIQAYSVSTILLVSLTLVLSISLNMKYVGSTDSFLLNLLLPYKLKSSYFYCTWDLTIIVPYYGRELKFAVCLLLIEQSLRLIACLLIALTDWKIGRLGVGSLTHNELNSSSYAGLRSLLRGDFLSLLKFLDATRRFGKSS